MKYGFNDSRFIPEKKHWTAGRILGLVLMLVLIIGVWWGLNQKLLLGEDWISPTYDNEDWRTNEGNLPTYGAWDIETHIWKTEYIVENFPHFQWNPDWYLGMPLLKYYQSGFYVASIIVMKLFSVSAARAAVLLVVYGHLLAALITFLLCYKISRRIWVAGFSSMFLFTTAFISLRSYGWEPITIVFLWLFPLGVYFFLKDPTKPFRPTLIAVMTLTYFCHPLIFFALCMTMGMYLLTIALRSNIDKDVSKRHFIWQYFALIGVSILLAAPQFVLQLSYEQVTSGAHMGVTYLPYYQVPFNIITPIDFFFDVSNLKGPGFVVMIAFILLIVFGLLSLRTHTKRRKGKATEHISQEQQNAKIVDGRVLGGQTIAAGLAVVLLTMVVFYYFELYDIFPMNFLRAIQYHRIIPEFVIVASVLIASLYILATTHQRKTFFATMLISFLLVSGIVLLNVEKHWATTDTLTNTPEWITDDFSGRMTHPYTDQSLAVRSTFTNKPQVYGYYEQGITNSYADELFSVSSGYHNANVTVLYLQAANVQRLYTNMEAGKRDAITRSRLRGVLPYIYTEGERYGYFEIPLANPSMVQAVTEEGARLVQQKAVGCRELYKVKYCGSVGEEFVTKDPAENAYLRAYVSLLGQPYGATAQVTRIHPDEYRITVHNATTDTAIIVKMTADPDFTATSNGREIAIEHIGPDFMLLKPQAQGTYAIDLRYHTPKQAIVGWYMSIATLIILLIGIIIFRSRKKLSILTFRNGDMT